jgi:hypothetical protein
MAKKQKDYGYDAFRLLQLAFIIAPIIAGFDKFFNLLTHWSMYLSPLAMRILNYNDRSFMMLVGIIEIIVGIGVYFKPKIFSYVVSAWLALIILNLLFKGMYFDIALHDLGLLLSALALGKLSKKYA